MLEFEKLLIIFSDADYIFIFISSLLSWLNNFIDPTSIY